MEQISSDKTALPYYCSGITRMWWNTRIPDFKYASDYWFNETLNMLCQSLKTDWLDSNSLVLDMDLFLIIVF